MAKSLAQIQAQIEKLQAQAEAVKAKEIAGVIARIKVAIAHYGLNAIDLGLAKQAGRKPGSKNKVLKAGGEAAASAPAAKKGRTKKAGPESATKAKVSKPKAAKAPGIAKYADGTGKTWTGNGKRPKWFVDAIAGGKTAQELLVQPAS